MTTNAPRLARPRSFFNDIYHAHKQRSRRLDDAYPVNAIAELERQLETVRSPAKRARMEARIRDLKREIEARKLIRERVAKEQEAKNQLEAEKKLDQ